MSKQLLTPYDYHRLHNIVFSDDYPGYKPNVVESPNGDGKLDTEKRYSHVAKKYLDQIPGRYPEQEHEKAVLRGYLDEAHELAIQVAVSIGVPRPFWPVQKYSALRVLEYGPTAITNEHTDFDLFTLMLYRNLPQYFNYTNGPIDSDRRKWVKQGRTISQMVQHQKSLAMANAVSPQTHFGELLEEIDIDTFKADDHEVVATEGPWQYSIVYFAIPDHNAVLPSGVTVGKWLEERIKRSRYER